MSILKYQKQRPQFLSSEQVDCVFKAIGENKKYRLFFAFLLYTGARLAEIQQLKWADIKDGKVRILKSKTYRPREIPISTMLKEILDEYNQGIGQIFDVSLDQVTHRIKYYLRKAGIENLRLHDIRHTFASQLIMSGVDIRTVQELLGHTSYSTTEIYAHLSQEHLKKAVEKLPF